MLTIKLTKISSTHHEFEYVRENGIGERLELETKTFFFHDLLHFAVESEAKLSNSFYGLLSKSKSYADLLPERSIYKDKALATTAPATIALATTEEVWMTERVVGLMTGVVRGEVSSEEFLTGIKNMCDAYNEQVPVWLTADFVLNVQERMRKLMGEWSGTPFGQTMILIFEV